ncbi:MAG: AAA family ATPase [Micavibrio sp.]|nr:AAA family ATPase [Micavibrio sp.]
MGEARKSDISVLLPAAKITIFSQDANTLEVAKSLSDDWRFVRVEVSAVKGDLQGAIKTYQDFSSPELVIIQTENMDEDFIAQLDVLASNCDEGTSAIIIGPENDVNLYRKLIDMGVSDYLVKPVKIESLSDVIARALINKKGVSGSSLITIIGAKGGVGVTTIAEGLACGVSDILKQKTLIMDVAGGASSLGVGFSFDPISTLSEAVQAAQQENDDNLKRMMHKVDDRLSVLATGGEAMIDNTINAEQLEILLDRLMITFPVVVLDLSSAPRELQRIALARSNKSIVVSTPTLSSLRLVRSLLMEVAEVHGGETSNISMLINMQGQAPAQEVGKKDIEEAIGNSVDSFVAFAPKAFLASESAGRKLSDDKDAKKVIEEKLIPLVEDVINSAVQVMSSDEKKSRIMGGLLGKLSGN